MENEQNSFDDPLAINQTNTESATKKKAKFNYTSKFALFYILVFEFQGVWVSRITNKNA